MEIENSVHRQPLVLTEIEVARYMGGAKGDLWIFCALQNILLHFLISRPVPAFPALGLNGDQAIRSFRSRVHMNDAAVEREGTLGSVEHGLQGPVDGRFCGIEGHRDGILRIGHGPGRGWQNQQAGDYDTCGNSFTNSFLAENAFHSFSVNKGLPQESSSRPEFPGASQTVACSGRQRVRRAVAESSLDESTAS